MGLSAVENDVQKPVTGPRRDWRVGSGGRARQGIRVCPPLPSSRERGVGGEGCRAASVNVKVLLFPTPQKFNTFSIFNTFNTFAIVVALG